MLGSVPARSQGGHGPLVSLGGARAALGRASVTLCAVAVVVQVEARTRKDIEEKKEELRQLVGASYRDLIESADSILAMRRQAASRAARGLPIPSLTSEPASGRVLRGGPERHR